MPTVLEFLSDSLADVGAMQPGQTPSGTDSSFALRKLNQMLQWWSSRRLRLFFIPEATYALTSNKGIYQIGPGAADFDTVSPATNVRPVFVQAAWLVLGAGSPRPLNILTRPQWNSVTSKNDTALDGPTDLFYDFNASVATINVAPRPFGPVTLHVTQWNPLRTFGPDELALNVEDYYPEEYIKAMRLGLAIELAPSYRFPVSPDLATLFQSAVGQLENMNNDKLSGSFGLTRSLDGPAKGEGSPVSAQQAQAPPQQVQR